jgi:hypothetical protein
MANASTSPAETETSRAAANGVSPQATPLAWGDNLALALSHTIQPTRRTSRAAKSHLGLVGRWVRWARVGAGAARDFTQLGVELGKPRILDPHLQQPLLDRVLPHACIDRWMPTCCAMAVAKAAAMQGIPACCGRSMEAAPRRSTWL